MALHKIKIHVTPSRRLGPRRGWNLHVTPNRQQARWKDEIEWECLAPRGSAPFLVYFGAGGPMTDESYSPGRPKGKVKFKPFFRPCIFKYWVGVYYQNEIKLLDPDLEIVP